MTPRLLPRLEGRFTPVLRVSDLDVSVVWYADAFGLSERSRHTPTPGRGQVVMTCPRTGLTLCLVSDGPAARGFDEHATGLDHLELLVADRAELSAWRAHLAWPMQTFTRRRDSSVASGCPRGFSLTIGH